MKTNDHIRTLMYRALDEPLSADEQARLDEALATSAALREEWEALQQLRRTLATFDAPADEGFTDRVMARIGGPTLSATLVRLWPRAIAAAVALLLIALLLLQWATSRQWDPDLLQTLTGLDDVPIEEAITFLEQ